ncbi:MAG: alpha/beta hydrolase [Oscillochloris sp.]|nr:alpha/beta hydrolase [Oscillochloris sp.]
MQTQTIQLDGQPVVYRESSGEGPAVLLIHGNSSSSRAYAPQFASELAARYRLVALDLPGFGESQPVADPERVLGLQGWAAMVRSLVAELNLDPLVLVGWSLGGHVALEVVGDLPGLRGVLIFGTPPIAFPPAMEQAFLPHPAMETTFKPVLTAAEMESYVASFFAPHYSELPATFIEDIRQSDGRSRSAVAISIRPDGYKDEVEVVARMQVPLAVLHGVDEQLINRGYFDSLAMPTLWRGEVQLIADAGHAPQWEQPERFNALLDAFVQDCVS